MSDLLSYVEWLEQVVAEYQPDWICDELVCEDGWCENHCKSDWNSECLKRYYSKCFDTADTPQTTLCRECDDYAGDGMYCASNYLVYDFSTSRENCEANTTQTNIDKAKADIAEWSSWSKTYEAMCGAQTETEGAEE